MVSILWHVKTGGSNQIAAAEKFARGCPARQFFPGEERSPLMKSLGQNLSRESRPALCGHPELIFL